MKTKNTTENKLHFALQHIGAETEWKNEFGQWVKGKLQLSNIEFYMKVEFRIVLTSLSDITDADLIKCYHLYCEICKYDYTQDFGTTLEMAKHLIEQEGYNWLLKYTKINDFLRSKSYAIQWRDYRLKNLSNTDG